MATPRVTRSSPGDRRYWAEVRRLLVSQHRYNQAQATRAVRNYRAVLSRTGLEDAVYHAPHARTAEGIVKAGYADRDATTQPQVKPSTRGKGRPAPSGSKGGHQPRTSR